MDLKQIRSDLEAQLKDVMGKAARLQDHLRNVDRELPSDWPDLAQAVGNDEVLEALEARSRARIDDLQGAIDRIDSGMYTRCAECGATIGAERLALLPSTAICAACAG